MESPAVSGRDGAVFAVAAVLATLLVLGLSASASALRAQTSTFDGSGSTAGVFGALERVAVHEGSGSVYAMDSGKGVVGKFDLSGAASDFSGLGVSSLDDSGTGGGDFGLGSDSDIAVDNSGLGTDGNLYVLDYGSQEVHAFDAAGAHLFTIADAGADVCGVAVDPDGDVWVSDYFGAVVEFDSAGAATGDSIDASGEIRPCHSAIDSAGNFYLADWDTDSLHKYGPAGAYLGEVSAGPVHSVAIDLSSDHVFAVGPDRVTEYSPAGAQLSEIGVGDLTSAIGAGAVAANGALYVSDRSDDQVHVFASVPTRALEVDKAGDGSGSVSSTPSGIDCGDACTASFAEGSEVVLTAAPAPDATFAGWSGACSGAGSCTVTMDGNRAVTANFAPAPTLAVTRTGSGSGLVESTPSRISCGSTCAAGFEEGTAVVLTATAAPGSRFAGWSGACSGTGTCGLAMDGDEAVTANFVLTPTLTVTKTGGGSGSVESAPPGIDCGSTCAAAFDVGTAVVLTATAAAGSRFAGWSGACSGTGTCSLTMSAAWAVTASFVPTHDLTVTKGGSGSGSVSSAPAGIDCGATCTAGFAVGSAVALTVAPGEHSRFAGWSGACSGAGACDVTMDAAKTAQANFAQLPPRVTAAPGASDIVLTRAKGRGFVNPRGSQITACRIEYGTTTGYGRHAPCAPAPGSGDADVLVTADLTGLTADTTYHFRVVAANVGGTSTGDDRTFTTGKAPSSCETDVLLCPPPDCDSTPILCPPPKAVTASLVGKATVKARKVIVTVACRGAGKGTCRGRLVLTARVRAKVRRRGRTRTVRKTISVGRASYRVAAGERRKIAVRLSSAARRRLRKGPLRVTAKRLNGSVRLRGRRHRGRR